MSHFQDDGDDRCECGDTHIVGLEMGPCCVRQGVWQADPFQEEIYGETNYSFMCDECYDQAVQEI